VLSKSRANQNNGHAPGFEPVHELHSAWAVGNRLEDLAQAPFGSALPKRYLQPAPISIAYLATLKTNENALGLDLHPQRFADMAEGATNGFERSI
jgi:hypothetical protein